MKLLLDTHTLLWWLVDDPRLGPKARGLMADPGNDVIVSTVSLWEIVLKARIGKLNADFDEIIREVEREGFSRLGIHDRHLQILQNLPMHHRDPLDHLLIAQAIAEAAVFLSADRDVKQYQVQSLGCAE